MDPHVLTVSSIFTNGFNTRKVKHIYYGTLLNKFLFVSCLLTLKSHTKSSGSKLSVK